MTDWAQHYDSLKRSSPATEQDRYHNANWDVVQNTLQGSSAYSGGASRAAICVVVNLPAVRAVRFLLPPAAGPGCGVYENRYRYAARVGQALPAGSIRKKIDAALSQVSPDTTLTSANGHYGAVELNGTGVRYFGDICLVLRPGLVGKNTLTLLRNSYDTREMPAAQKLKNLSGPAWTTRLKAILQTWAGAWEKDGVYIAASKIMENTAQTNRRMTTATVSEGVLQDEDYIEVILPHDFAPCDLQEIRVAATDAAAEALIGDQSRVGGAPHAADALWRFRRRIVTMLAQAQSIPCRVITTTGRSR